MKTITTITLAFLLCAALAVPALAGNSYEFKTGEETLQGFGNPTPYYNPVPVDPENENVRNNKDAALLPPPYFYGSGDIPTDHSSQYHDNLPGGSNAGHNSGAVGNPGGSPTPHPLPGYQAPTSTVVQNTAPLYYPDGSIGTLYVAETGRTVKVFEGEQLSNLKKGAGHFSMTSAWDGNVAMCGHNRGSAGYFSFVKDMRTGDRVTYATLYGSRTYEVFSKERISEYDYSKLGWAAENTLTLITCIENSPDFRWAVQLHEVR